MRPAFPSSLASEVDHVVGHLPPAKHPPTAQAIGPVTIGGESLRIPHRVYVKPTSAPSLTPTQLRIWCCIYSRHSDGFVRQQHLKQLLDADELWVVPFVLQLVGEYVLEIVQLIESRRDVLTRPVYRAFALENPRFLELTKQRSISYWHCYHRHRFRRKDEYPGLQVLSALERSQPDDEA